MLEEGKEGKEGKEEKEEKELFQYMKQYAKLLYKHAYHYEYISDQDYNMILSDCRNLFKIIVDSINYIESSYGINLNFDKNTVLNPDYVAPEKLTNQNNNLPFFNFGISVISTLESIREALW